MVKPHPDIAAVIEGRSPWTVVHGDCRESIDLLRGHVDAIVSDPPWGRLVGDTKAGTRAVTDSRRFSGGDHGDGRLGAMGRSWPAIIADDEPFDPSPWIAFPKVILFGSNHFGQRLPVGTTLVWIKRNDDMFGTFLSDAEVAWMKGGHGVYCFRQLFPPPSRIAETGECVHPTQKPEDLMRWCIERLNLKPGDLVWDPYSGSGTTGVAAVRLGFRFIGHELEPAYAATARRRIADAAPLFVPAPKAPEPELFRG